MRTNSSNSEREREREKGDTYTRRMRNKPIKLSGKFSRLKATSLRKKRFWL
jgi:hypothetical protein